MIKNNPKQDPAIESDPYEGSIERRHPNFNSGTHRMDHIRDATVMVPDITKAGGTFFKQRIAEWTESKLKAFLDARYEFLTGPGGICEPRERHGQSSYRLKQRLGGWEHSITCEQDDLLSKQADNPISLITADPTAPSRFRTNGLAVWDVALYLPDPKLMVPNPVGISTLPSRRNRNTHWIENGPKLLASWGRPGGPTSPILRPAGPYVFDLMKIQNGWDILEAAHVLTHMRADQELAARASKPYDLCYLSNLFQRCLSEIMVALAYDIPLDVRSRPTRQNGDSNLPFGLTVATTTHLSSPNLIVPLEGPGRLVFDKTIAVINVATHLQPYPDGFVTGVWSPDAQDRWCCAPTIVAITGWADTQVATHWSLATYRPNESSSPVFLAMHPNDLMPPDDLNAVLALAWRRSGLPPAGWQYISDWMGSDEYLKAYMKTPPLPCSYCLSINRNSPSAPRRPRPHRGARYDADVWTNYAQEVAPILKIVEAGTVAFEGKRYGSPKNARTLRSKRRQQYRAHMKMLKHHAWMRKYRDNFCCNILTGQQDQKYHRFMNIYGDVAGATKPAIKQVGTDQGCT